MEAKRPDPHLSLQPFDPEVFQRVWNRVMPDQEHSPISVNSTQSSAPTTPAVPAFSPAPEESPKAPLTCLGEDSQPYLQTVEDMMEQTQGFLHTLQRLSRRSQGRTARVLYGLASELRRELRQLSTAYFLISGVRYLPADRAAPRLESTFLGTLRARFLAEQRGEAAYRAAAEGCQDPCLRALYLELAQEEQGHSLALRSILEEL